MRNFVLVRAVFLLILVLGCGGVWAEEAVVPLDKSASVTGRFFDAHVHFNDCKAGDLEKVAAWMQANNVQRIINHPLAQSRPKNEAERAQQVIAHSDWWKNLPDGTCDRLLETYPNLYADISCTVGRSVIGRDTKFAREFFIRRADKLLFGTDSGWWSLGKEKGRAPEFALIDELKLPKDVEEKICRGNAERLFGRGDVRP
ncbi:MAG: amidohydrolase family protein [Planctomycetota bacterium]